MLDLAVYHKQCMTFIKTILLLWAHSQLAIANTNDGDGDCYCDDATECLTTVNSDCTVPIDLLAIGDCDDTDPDRSPETQWYIDEDQDGYGVPSTLFWNEADGLSAGPRHSCSLLSDQTIGCWGDDSDGVVSDVPDSDYYDRVASGDNFACASNNKSFITCWGDDTHQQISAAPSEGSTLGLSTGASHACVITQYGLPECWGLNTGGTIGSVDGPNTYAQKTSAIAAGGSHTCLIKVSVMTDNIECWGDNSKGQVSNSPNGLFHSLVAGKDHSCAILSNTGAIECWGSDQYGQSSPPAGGRYSSLSVGNYHSCAITTGGQAYCWGVDDGSPQDTGQVSDTPNQPIYSTIAADGLHTCATTTSGSVHCWGDNKYGQSTPYTNSAPVYQCERPTGLSTAYSRHDTDCDDGSSLINPGSKDKCDNALDENCSGDNATCGSSNVDNDGDGYKDDVDCADNQGDDTVYPGAQEICDGLWNNCDHPDWDPATAPGDESDDDLDGYVECERATTGWAGAQISGGGDCDDSDDQIHQAVYYYLDEDGDNYGIARKSLSSTANTMCSLADSGTIECWGDETANEVSGTPTGTGYVQVVSGNLHHCALHNDGSVFCWGDDATHGQVTSTPSGTGFVWLDAGELHTCALDDSGSATCWGHEGDGTRDPTVEPTTLFTTLASGYGHTCGLTDAGAVECWGDSALQAEPSGSGYSSLTSGTDFACVLNDTGVAICWGDNTALSDTPTTSGNLAVIARSESVCLIEAGGGLYCWSSSFAGPYSESSGTPYEQVAITDELICGIHDDGAINCIDTSDGSILANTPRSAGNLDVAVADDFGGCFIGALGQLDCFRSGNSSDPDLWPPYPGEYCSNPGAGYAKKAGDCDNSDPATSLGSTYYPDADGDGLGDPTGQTEIFCFANNSGYSADNTDCNDDDPSVGGPSITYYPDSDGDGYGDSTNIGTMACSPIGDEVSNNSDCDDNDAGVTQGDYYYEDHDHDGLGQAITSVAVGDYNTCAIDSVGQLSCWGSDADNVISGIPASSNTAIVSVGQRHACKINILGKITCWGDDSHNLVSEFPAFGYPFSAIDSDVDYSCAIDRDGGIQCWGDDANDAVNGPPAAVNHTAISTGDNFACAVNDAETITCWGDDTNDRVNGAPTTGNFTDVAAGDTFACALGTDGSLTCWGDNAFGQISGVPTAGVFVSLALGDTYGCAIDEDEAMSCWGYSAYVDLWSAPSWVPSSIAASDHHACIITDGVKVECWGINDSSSNDFGQVTTGNDDPAYFCADPGFGYAQTAGDCDPSSWYTQDATLYYFDTDGDGDGGGGQDGLPLCFDPGTDYVTTNTDCDDDDDSVLSGIWYYWDDDKDGYGGYNQPAELFCSAPTIDYATNNDDCYDTDAFEWEPHVYFSDGDGDGVGTSVASIAVTPLQSCATDSSGAISCWGFDNGSDSPLNNIPSGSVYTTLVGSTANDFGYYPFYCALDVDGAISCWGDDYYGQVSDAPVDLGYLKIVAGEYHACALHQDKTLTCWGDDLDDQVFDAPTATDFIELDSSERFTCALKESGEISCWGYDWYNQVANTPVGSGYVALTTGRNHACAINNSAGIECWGIDDGSSYDDGQVTGAPTATGFEQVSLGEKHSCALTTDGEIECWGDDTWGQTEPPPTDGWASISSGLNYNCVIAGPSSIYPEGTLACWGQNTELQVSNAPLDDGYEVLALSNFHACALDNVGRLVCWGAEAAGAENGGQANGPSFPIACDAPSSDYATSGGDCDDGDDTVGAAQTYYRDFDGDSYGDSSDAGMCTSGLLYITDNTDCDDGDSEEYPGVTWYPDADGDSLGDENDLGNECESVDSTDVTDNTDCNDTDFDIPSGGEVVGNDVDEDCDGFITCYADGDGDGDGDSGNTVELDASESCALAAGASDNADDCNDNNEDYNSGVTWYPDLDGDTYGDENDSGNPCERINATDILDSTDCGDDDDKTFPDAPETCDGIDNDCDGLADDADSDTINQSTWYLDSDGDGYGDVSPPVVACDKPTGYVANSTDCDDTDHTVYPGAVEVCDGTDNNCDGQLEADSDDADGDGYRICAGDCDDTESAVNPGMTEVTSDSLNYDEDCDGELSCYADSDGDGYGTATNTITILTSASCGTGSGTGANNALDCNDDDDTERPGVTWYEDNDGDSYGDGDYFRNCQRAYSTDVLDHSDCDDSDATVHPGADEICDGIDNNCNADPNTQPPFDGIDDNDPELNPSTGTLWYEDADNDGFGDSTKPKYGCDLTEWEDPWYVDRDDAFDCDDTNDEIHPLAIEICESGVDEDCDDWDPPCNGTDLDGDNFCGAATCDQDNDPSTPLLIPGDCDDSDATIYPGAQEECDGVDNNCDSFIDEGLSPDGDSDGYTAIGSCQTGSMDDCNDYNYNVHPDASEICNGIDDDCDTFIDEDLIFDLDGDGYLAEGSCGYVWSYDCDDNNAYINPGATEDMWNGVDDDCDDIIDNDSDTVDNDGDGYCEHPTTCSDGSQPEDCDDTDITIHPDAPEVADNIDNNCDGLIDNFDAADNDNDGFTAAEGDCDDFNAAIAPNATETCNGLDDNCDGYMPVDEFDMDRDGFVSCENFDPNLWLGSPFVYGGDDCDDTNDKVWPGRAEDCSDGIDNNCDDIIDTDADADGDGVTTCEGDCNDSNKYIYPGMNKDGDYAFEECNGLDDDCDGLTDEGFDIDLDNFNDCDQCIHLSPPQCDCDDSNALVRPGVAENCDDEIDNNCDGEIDEVGIDRDGDGWDVCDDCNDDLLQGGYDVNPSAPERCNLIDDNCDGIVDEGYDQDEDDVSSCAGDCDDLDADIYIGAVELCDDVDQDCNPETEPGDKDADGWLDAACGGEDCDDTNGAIGPDQEEVCDDDLDNNCDDLTDSEDAICLDPSRNTAGDVRPGWFCGQSAQAPAGWLGLLLPLLLFRRRSEGRAA